MTEKKTTHIATAALLLGVFFWGGTFPVIKEAVGGYDVFSFIAIRFSISTVILAALFFRRLRRCSGETFRKGVVIGIVLAVSFVTQTIGIKYTSVSNAAFITGLYIVVVAVLATALDRRLPGPLQIVSAAVALAGLVVLTFRLPFSLNAGDWWILACAGAFGAHVVMIGRMVRGGIDPLAFSVVQSAVVALTAGAIGLAVNGRLEPPGGLVEWRAVVYCAVFATAYMYTAQAYFQSRMTELKAAIIFSLEPLFAALIAHFYPGIYEQLTARTLVGGVMICAAMALSEIRPRGAAALASKFSDHIR